MDLIHRRSSFFFAGLLLFALSPAVQASDLLPLQTGNVWRLSNASAEFILTVEEAIASGDRTLGRIRFQNPFAEYSWIVLDDASGIRLAGYAFNGIETFFDEPTPLFPSNGRTGQVWTGLFTRVTQRATGVQVRTPLGTFRNGVEFEIDFADGSRQWWVMAPGLGFLAGGQKTAQLPVQSHRLLPPTASSTSVQACTKGGISAIPVDASLSTASREAALAPVTSLGGNLLSVSIAWNELEPSPYQYASARIRDELRIAQKHRLDVVLSIRPVDNVRDMRPADLAGRPWDSPEVMNRFAAALDHVLSGLPAEVRWINIGYEIDPYFLARPAELVPFLRLFQFSRHFTKQKTGLSVGSVFSFDVLRGNSAVFRMLERDCDHVSFNYYALRSGASFAHRSTDSPAIDTLAMRSFAKGRSILITEAGYSSHPGVGGGPDAQSAFFRSLFTHLRMSPEAAGVNVWALNDMPEALVRETVTAYGIQPMPGSIEFMSGLGLIASGGAVKPALATVSTEINKNLSACGVR